MSDAEIREALARAERARRHVNGLCIGTMKWRMRVPPQADDSDLVICNALDDSKRLAADLLAARAERDEARAFIRDFLHTTSGKKSLDGAPLSRLESAAQRLLSPTPSHTCQMHRATSGASDCGLEPCEEATVHRDRGEARSAENATPEAVKCATCGGGEWVLDPPHAPDCDTPVPAGIRHSHRLVWCKCGARGHECPDCGGGA